MRAIGPAGVRLVVLLREDAYRHVTRGAVHIVFNIHRAVDERHGGFAFGRAGSQRSRVSRDKVNDIARRAGPTSLPGSRFPSRLT